MNTAMRMVELPETMLQRAERILEEDWAGWEDLEEYLRAALRDFNRQRERSIPAYRKR